MTPEKCPSCDTPVMEAPGIGPYCPNPDCWRIDELRPDAQPSSMQERVAAARAIIMGSKLSALVELFRQTSPIHDTEEFEAALRALVAERDAALANEGAMQRRLAAVLEDTESRLTALRAKFVAGAKKVIEVATERDRLAHENERLRQADREAGSHVEAVIVMRTNFSGEPPYVGWKGLGLSLNEALDERDALRAEVAALLKDKAIRAGTFAALADKQQDHQQPISSAEETAAVKAALSNGPPSDEERAMIERGLL